MNMRCNIGNIFGCFLIFGFSVRLSASSGVDVAPYFTIEPLPAIINPMESVTLNCDAEPSGVDIWWLLDGSPLTSRQGELVRGKHLRIPGRRSSSGASSPETTNAGGQYQCVANNSVGALVSRHARITRTSLNSQDEKLPDRSIFIVEGNTAVVPCATPRSIPSATTEFELNGSKLLLTSRHFILPSGNLQIANAGISDRGTYRCVSTNPISRQRLTSTNHVLLHVNLTNRTTMPRFTWTPVTNVEIIRGQTLMLECVAEGWPVPTIKWIRNEGSLPPGRFYQRLGNLVIENIDRSDKGTYICQAESSGGQPQASVSFVDVLELPRFSVQPLDQNVTEGSSVSLNVQVSGTPTPQLSWLHNTREITPSQIINIIDSKLVILSVASHHAGLYQCVAVNAVGMDYASIRLSIRPNSTKDRVASEMQNIAPDFLSSAVRLTSTVQQLTRTSSPLKLKKSNRKNGKESDSSSSADKRKPVQNRQNGENPKKSIEKPLSGGISPGGKRKSTANGDGHDPTAKVKLVPPSKPTVSKASDTSVLLEWKLPENDGLRVTFFKVQYRHAVNKRRKSGSWQTIEEDLPATTKSYRVVGLKSGSTYQFRLVAVYSNQDNKHGPNSATVTLGSSAYQPRAPSAVPVIVEVQALSTTSISIAWRYIPVERVPLSGFHIYYKPYESTGEYERRTVHGSGVRRMSLTSLSEGTTYSLRMKSFNSDGLSDFSNTAVKKTQGTNVELEYSEVDNQHKQIERILGIDVVTGIVLPNTFPPNVGVQQHGAQTLYVVLGVVLGLVTLVLGLIIVTCVWKQRQRRNHLMSKPTKPPSSANSPPNARLHNGSTTNKALIDERFKNNGGRYENTGANILRGGVLLLRQPGTDQTSRWMNHPMADSPHAELRTETSGKGLLGEDDAIQRGMIPFKERDVQHRDNALLGRNSASNISERTFARQGRPFSFVQSRGWNEDEKIIDSPDDVTSKINDDANDDVSRRRPVSNRISSLHGYHLPVRLDEQEDERSNPDEDDR